MTGNCTFTPKFCSMFRIQAMCEYTLSTELPISCTLRLTKSSCRFENSTNSVVQTGVKSAGCEKSTTHLPLEVKSVSFSVPCVLLASKSGATSLMRGILASLMVSSRNLLAETCCENLSDAGRNSQPQKLASNLLNCTTAGELPVVSQ